MLPNKNDIFKVLNRINIVEERYLKDLIKITESGAIAAFFEIGRGDIIKADFESVKSIRSTINNIDINGTIKIGEGTRDNAPMLYTDEKVGTGKGLNIDIAVDPLEGTNFVSLGMPGSISAMSMVNENGLFRGPDIYFDKIVVGPKILNFINKRNYKINIKYSILKNLEIISKALNKEISEISVTILNRERHNNIIKELRNLNVHVSLIQDGDLWPGILTCFDNSGIDVVLGMGGSGEAVLTASVLKCLGGYITGELVLPSVLNNESKRVIKLELESIQNKFKYINDDPFEIYKQLNTNDLVPGNDIIFSTSSITGNSMLLPITITNNKVSIMSFIASSFNKYKIITSNYII